VQVSTGQGLTTHPYRVLQRWRRRLRTVRGVTEKEKNLGVRAGIPATFTRLASRDTNFWNQPAKRQRWSVHRETRSPQGRPHSPKLETASLRVRGQQCLSSGWRRCQRNGSQHRRRARRKASVGWAPRGSAGVHEECGMCVEKPQGLGRPWALLSRYIGHNLYRMTGRPYRNIQ